MSHRWILPFPATFDTGGRFKTFLHHLLNNPSLISSHILHWKLRDAQNQLHRSRPQNPSVFHQRWPMLKKKKKRNQKSWFRPLDCAEALKFYDGFWACVESVSAVNNAGSSSDFSQQPRVFGPDQKNRGFGERDCRCLGQMKTMLRMCFLGFIGLPGCTWFYPLITAIGLSLIAFWLIPASWPTQKQKLIINLTIKN